MVHPQEIIRRKRNGETLSKDELTGVARGMADGSFSEGQAAAFAMAVYFRGMTTEETADWTLSMRDSGEILQWPKDRFSGPLLDKHSTGGVGDKVSLVLAPMLAACGAVVPMVSGRGLGHTGGTLDKLESIPGFRTDLGEPEMAAVLEAAGCAIVSASESIAPADRRLYAIRDVTATVDSIPLITASILSKKMAAGLEGLVLDVKTGSGAFANTTKMAEELASSLVDVGNASGLPTRALITDMNQVLGTTAGNALEVIESLDYLRGESKEQRFDRVVTALGAAVLQMGGLAADSREAHSMLIDAIEGGGALEHFGRMATGQGAPPGITEDYRRLLPGAIVVMPAFAERPGFIQAMDVRRIGMAVVELGGGRRLPGDRVDHAVGLSAVAGIGDEVGPESPVAFVHAHSREDAERAAKILAEAVVTGEQRVSPGELIASV